MLKICKYIMNSQYAHVFAGLFELIWSKGILYELNLNFHLVVSTIIRNVY